MHLSESEPPDEESNTTFFLGQVVMGEGAFGTFAEASFPRIGLEENGVKRIN